MSLLQEFATSCIHWSFGLTVLCGLTASEFSGAITIAALPITVISITLSALCGSSLCATNTTYKKRKLCDILEFLKIWIEVLELLAASATSARIASATIDYISNQRLREWIFGFQSHSLGEPWPDVLGVSVVIVVTALFMLGLEKSSSFSALLLISVFGTFIFFICVGSTHTIVHMPTWSQDFKNCSIHSVLTAATVCSYGFTNTFPKMSSHRTLKIITMVIIPLILYSSTIVVFTFMTHYKELAGTAIPLLRVFELRDVDWARLVMSVCIICIVCLALTEILPSLYGLFITLAGKEWQIFLTSLQYKNSFTGAPLLAIFAAGSLTAILAFACPLTYLVKILNAATLLKCIFKSLHILYCYYRPESGNESYLVSSTSSQYTKLKQSTKGCKEIEPNGTNKFVGLFSGWKKNISPSSSHNRNGSNTKPGTTQDDEYLLLNDYCDKSVDLALNDDSSDEKESVLSSDVEDSYSSTDIDAVVQEYKDKIQVATIDSFPENKHPTYVTATTVLIFLIIIIISTICISQAVICKLFNLLWLCFTVLFFSTIVILVMPKNSITTEDELLPKSIIQFFAIISLECNIVLVAIVLKEDIWPGFIFWFSVGCLLFWRCDCCTCDGLVANNQKSKLNITENISQYADKCVDTILIAR